MALEATLARLEQIVGELDGEELELDRALRLFEEGVEQLRSAVAELSHAETRVRQLSETASGIFELTDLSG